MKSALFSKTFILMLIAALITAGCLARGGTMPESDVDLYEQALADRTGHIDGIALGLQKFTDGYHDLTRKDLEERMAALYAEDIYFNDTIHTFHSRQALLDYLVRTGAGLEESTVEVKQVIRDEADVFVRWTMDFKTRAAGRNIHSRSIGMTHLRFNEDGQVILHQDFWDSGNALYAHLPIVGFAVRSARDRM